VTFDIITAVDIKYCGLLNIIPCSAIVAFHSLDVIVSMTEGSKRLGTVT
jgi:hypothetical protein